MFLHLTPNILLVKLHQLGENFANALKPFDKSLAIITQAQEGA
jgi:hypothetical protein